MLAPRYGNPEAGRLIKTLVAEGNKPQPDEVAEVFGMPFDLRPAEARLRRLAAETSGPRGCREARGPGASSSRPRSWRPRRPGGE